MLEAAANEEMRGKEGNLAGIKVLHERVESGVICVGKRDFHLKRLTIAIEKHDTKSDANGESGIRSRAPVANQTEEDAMTKYSFLFPNTVSRKKKDDIAQFFRIEESFQLALQAKGQRRECV